MLFYYLKKKKRLLAWKIEVNLPKLLLKDLLAHIVGSPF